MPKQTSLAELIDGVKSEVLRSQASESPKMFLLHEVTIVTKVAVKKSGAVGGKISIYVLQANADGKVDSEETHEITIKLLPIKDVFLGDD